MRSEHHCLRLLPPLLAATAGWLLSITPSAAQMTPCASASGGGIGAFGDTIAVNNVIGMGATELQQGIAYWQDCQEYGQGFANFQPNSSAEHEVRVYYWGGNSGGNFCGLYHPDGRIEIWDEATRPDGSTVSCQGATQVLAHELGHALGLANSSCPGYIMSNSLNASVQPSECSVADENWVTVIELDDPDPGGPNDPCGV